MTSKKKREEIRTGLAGEARLLAASVLAWLDELRTESDPVEVSVVGSEVDPCLEIRQLIPECDEEGLEHHVWIGAPAIGSFLRDMKHQLESVTMADCPYTIEIVKKQKPDI